MQSSLPGPDHHLSIAVHCQAGRLRQEGGHYLATTQTTYTWQHKSNLTLFEIGFFFRLLWLFLDHFDQIWPFIGPTHLNRKYNFISQPLSRNRLRFPLYPFSEKVWRSLLSHSTARALPLPSRPLAQAWAGVSGGSLRACWTKSAGQRESTAAWRCRKARQSSMAARWSLVNRNDFLSVGNSSITGGREILSTAPTNWTNFHHI